MMESVSSFISPLSSFFSDEHYYYLAMTLAEKGDTLAFVLPKHPQTQLFQKLGENSIRFILACVVLGLEYLHTRDIVYFDLKP
jgi:serine/threonine protein kinase